MTDAELPSPSPEPPSVAFVYRVAIELIAAGENANADVVTDRSERRTWLEARDYRVVDVREADVVSDLDAVLAGIETRLTREASS